MPRVKPWKPETINNKGYQYSQRGDIRARINELKEEITKEIRKTSKITIEMILDDLKEIDAQAKHTNDLKIRIQVAQEKSKLWGIYAPTKQENTNTVLQLPTTISFKKI